VPTRIGGVRLVGGTLLGASGIGVTIGVDSLVADAGPAKFVAVTVTRKVEPTSVATRAYVVPVAFEIAEQSPPSSHLFHW